MEFFDIANIYELAHGLPKGSMGAFQENEQVHGRDGIAIEVWEYKRLAAAGAIAALLVVAYILGIHVYSAGVRRRKNPTGYYIGWCDIAGGIESLQDESTDPHLLNNRATFLLAAGEGAMLVDSTKEWWGTNQDDEEFDIISSATRGTTHRIPDDDDNWYEDEYRVKRAALQERACRMLLPHEHKWESLYSRLLLDETLTPRKVAAVMQTPY